MTSSVELAKMAEASLVQRISQRRENITAPNAANRIALLEFFLGLTRRYIAGERGTIGSEINGKFHWDWGDEGPDTNSIVSEFAFAAEKECAGLTQKKRRDGQP